MLTRSFLLSVLFYFFYFFSFNASAEENYSLQIIDVFPHISKAAQGFGPSCTNRQKWTSKTVFKKTNELRRSAEKLLNKEFPVWDQKSYLEYSLKGLRTNGQNMMNARKVWLYPLVIAECVEGMGRFIPLIEKTIIELIE
jgi:hypothetical protein